jgi:DNA-binding CsgD family transcriptional regulator
MASRALSGDHQAIAGRESELEMLHACFSRAEAGYGSLVLMSGEAGIGKTTLVRDLVHQAAERGWMVLQGGCYDLTSTPPYGPWIEIIRSYPVTSDGLPKLPDQIQHHGDIAGIGSQSVLFELFHEFFSAISKSLPLLLVLEDLHWSDPSSLDLLRFLGRNCEQRRILLLATYRDDELSLGHEFARTLPALVRESRPERLRLPPLDQRAIHEFIASRYDLDTEDLRKLSEHVWERADGNPFFASEILQGLEDDRLLQRMPDGWQLGDIERVRVPLLLRQVIDGRLSRLSPETRAALQIAAVIGQEIRLSIWREVSGLSGCDLDTVLAEASDVHLIGEIPAGTALQFRHALLREALYESLTLNQRRDWHRRVGEALAKLPTPEPDSIAHHFQHARDPKAEAWLVQAGEHAQRSCAWKSASERFEQALQWIGEGNERAAERGWLLYRAGRLLRHSHHKRARSFLERAYKVASALGDDVLTAYALCDLGLLRWLSGDMRRGLEEIAAGDELLDELPADHASPGSIIAAWIADALPADQLIQTQDDGAVTSSPVINTRRGTRIGVSAQTGYFEQAKTLGDTYLHRVATVQKPSALLLGSIGDACHGLTMCESAAGYPEQSWHWFERSLRAYHAIDHHFMIALVARFQLYEVAVTYDAADLAVRIRLVDEFESAFQQSVGVHPPNLPVNFGKLPVLFLEGQWIEARRVATMAIELDLDAATAHMVRALLAETAYCQGDSDVTEEQIRAILPDGPMNEPGDCYFLAGLYLQRIACSLALDRNDLDRARDWVEAHDRWLAWSGAVLGWADGQLIWARYHQLKGDRDAAQALAETALRQATDPRQPRALLSAHRFLGALATQQRRVAEADTHLAQALDLAQQCQAPYERALTLLELVELRLKQGRLQQARASLDEVQDVCTSLGAAPTLDRAGELARRLKDADVEHPDGLTTREVDVLRLLAAGKSNRQMAEMLFLSVRTIERHVANIYGKTDAHNRSEARAYAKQHGLTPS